VEKLIVAEMVKKLVLSVGHAFVNYRYSSSINFTVIGDELIQFF
jgi:hypothetical protein